MSTADPGRRAVLLAGLAAPLTLVAAPQARPLAADPSHPSTGKAMSTPANTAVTVTVELHPQQQQTTLAVLAKALPVTRQYAGCQFCNSYVDQDSNTIVLIQRWESRAHQQRYIAWRESTGDLKQLVDTLASPPQVRFWSLTDV